MRGRMTAATRLERGSRAVAAATVRQIKGGGGERHHRK
jgi:hypothetical protein